MSEAEKFLTVIKELGEIIADKNSTIVYLNYQLDDLKKKLEEAEAQIRAKEIEAIE